MASTFVRSFRGSSGQGQDQQKGVESVRLENYAGQRLQTVKPVCVAPGRDQRSRLQCLRAVKDIAQFVFNPFQNALLLLWKTFPGAIDVEVQHRHR
jgi:hypothetical protein